MRGYTYGTRRGRAFWSAQLDLQFVQNDWVAPVVFADAGGLFAARDPMVGAGIGASLFKGWMRVDLAKGLAPSAPARLDISFQQPR